MNSFDKTQMLRTALKMLRAKFGGPTKPVSWKETYSGTLTVSDGYQEAHAGSDVRSTPSRSHSTASAKDDGDSDPDPDPERRRNPRLHSPSATLLRLSALAARCDVSHSHIYSRIRDGLFPPPIKIERTSRWIASEIDDLIASQMSQPPMHIPQVVSATHPAAEPVETADTPAFSLPASLWWQFKAVKKERAPSGGAVALKKSNLCLPTDDVGADRPNGTQRREKVRR